MSNIANQISHLAPCSEARQWLGTQNSWEEAWNNCSRADWMFWLIEKDKSITCNQLVVCACAIARTSLKYVREGELKPLVAIETAERWARGEATIKEVRTARNDAYAAAADADAVAHAAAAANAAANAAAAAADAAYAAAAAADAAYAAADADARANAQKENCRIIRSYFPNVPNVLRKEKVKA